jgi:hypothetical protein
MSGQAVLDRFVEKNPLAVMTRSIMGCLMDERLDEVFQQNRSRQYDDTIKFSTVAMAMGEIALGTVKNRNQAYRKYKEELQTSNVAFYGKLNRIEPAISEGVVQYSADRAGEMLEALGFEPWEVLPGYRAKIWDGNHLQKTEKRLTETRGLCAAPLPGTIVARFDPQQGLFDKAFVLEDAHAQETTVLDLMVEDVQERDLHIADRNFCVVHYCLKIHARSGCFLIRQNGRLKGNPIGKRKRRGRIATGMVYEQMLEITDKGESLVVRRITVKLDEPTREGDMEIHILTNVPRKDGDARRLAEIYRQRWEIENAFYLLTTTLNCEMPSNCYPRCALFQFCMAMMAFNCMQVLTAALYAEHEEEDVDAMSRYHMSIDIVSPMEGMLTAINEQEWEALTPQSISGIASFLCKVSRHVNVRSYRKSVRGPKKPPPKRKRCKAGTHVSTHRLLEERKQRC